MWFFYVKSLEACHILKKCDFYDYVAIVPALNSWKYFSWLRIVYLLIPRKGLAFLSLSIENDYFQTLWTVLIDFVKMSVCLLSHTTSQTKSHVILLNTGDNAKLDQCVVEWVQKWKKFM